MATGPIKQVTNNSGAGYCKMPDGTLIQWGESTIDTGSTGKRIFFPVNFDSTFYGISVAGVFANTRALTWAFASQSPGSIDIYRGVTDTSYDQPFRWMAIGRWK